MKKLFKFGAILLLIGFLGTVAISFAYRDQLPEILDYQLVEKSYSMDDFSSINVRVLNKEINIEKSADDQVHLKYYVQERYFNHELSVDSDELKLVITRPSFLLVTGLSTLEWFLEDEFRALTLALPDKAYAIKVKTDNGAIKLGNVAASNVSLETDNGTITVLSSIITKLNLQTSNGTLRLEQTSITGDTDIRTSNGRIYIKDLAVNNIVAKTSNGRIEAENISANAIELRTSNGKIIGDNIESNNTLLRTSNGAITLNLKDAFKDYRLSVETDNGKITVDGNKYSGGTYNIDRERKVDLKTSNGSITVTFNQS